MTDPTPADYLDTIACLIAQRDALLIECGRPPLQGGRVELSVTQRHEGHDMGPAGYIGEQGQLVVRCDL